MVAAGPVGAFGGGPEVVVVGVVPFGNEGFIDALDWDANVEEDEDVDGTEGLAVCAGGGGGKDGVVVVTGVAGS